MYTQKHEKKTQCKQNDMLTQKHEQNNVNKIICKHRNTKKTHVNKLLCKQNNM